DASRPTSSMASPKASRASGVRVLTGRPCWSSHSTATSPSRSISMKSRIMERTFGRVGVWRCGRGLLGVVDSRLFAEGGWGAPNVRLRHHLDEAAADAPVVLTQRFGMFTVEVAARFGEVDPD